MWESNDNHSRTSHGKVAPRREGAESTKTTGKCSTSSFQDRCSCCFPHASPDAHRRPLLLLSSHRLAKNDGVSGRGGVHTCMRFSTALIPALALEYLQQAHRQPVLALRCGRKERCLSISPHSCWVQKKWQKSSPVQVPCRVARLPDGARQDADSAEDQDEPNRLFPLPHPHRRANTELFLCADWAGLDLSHHQDPKQTARGPFQDLRIEI